MSVKCQVPTVGRFPKKRYPQIIHQLRQLRIGLGCSVAFNHPAIGRPGLPWATPKKIELPRLISVHNFSLHFEARPKLRSDSNLLVTAHDATRFFEKCAGFLFIIAVTDTSYSLLMILITSDDTSYRC